MQVTTEIASDDHQSFTRYVWYSGARGGWAWFVMMFVAVVMLSSVLESKAHIHLHTPTMLITMIILTGYLALAQRRIRPFEDGASLGIRTFELSPEGLWERSRDYEMLTRWSGVRAVDETRTHLFVFIDNCQAHIIPKRAFTSSDECGRFAAQLKQRVGGLTKPSPAEGLGEAYGIS